SQAVRAAAFLRPAGIPRRAGRQRQAIPGAGLRSPAAKLSRSAGTAPAQDRPDRLPLPEDAGLLSTCRGRRARQLLPCPVPAERRRVRRTSRVAFGAMVRQLPVPPGPCEVDRTLHGGAAG